MDQTVASSRDTGLAGAVDPERVVMGETATIGHPTWGLNSGDVTERSGERHVAFGMDTQRNLSRYGDDSWCDELREASSARFDAMCDLFRAELQRRTATSTVTHEECWRNLYLDDKDTDIECRLENCPNFVNHEFGYSEDSDSAGWKARSIRLGVTGRVTHTAEKPNDTDTGSTGITRERSGIADTHTSHDAAVSSTTAVTPTNVYPVPEDTLRVTSGRSVMLSTEQPMVPVTAVAEAVAIALRDYCANTLSTPVAPSSQTPLTDKTVSATRAAGSTTIPETPDDTVCGGDGGDDGDSDRSSGDSHRARSRRRRSTPRRRRRRRNSSTSSGDGTSSRERTSCGDLSCPHYDGTTSFEVFWNQFEICRRSSNWSEKKAFGQLCMLLRKDAAQPLYDSGRSIETVAQLEAVLRERFGAAQQRDRYRAELRVRRRKPDESISTLRNDFLRLLALAYPNQSNQDRQEIGLESFLDALNDPELAHSVRQKATTVSEAASEALKYEIWLQDRDRRQRENGVIKSSAVHAATPSTPTTATTTTENQARRTVWGLDEDGPPIELTLEERLNKFEKLLQDMVTAKSENPQNKDRGQKNFSRRKPPVGACWRCGVPGHHYSQCPYTPNGGTPSIVSNSSNITYSQNGTPVQPQRLALPNYGYTLSACQPVTPAASRPHNATQLSQTTMTAPQYNVPQASVSQPNAGNEASNDAPGARGIPNGHTIPVYIKVHIGRKVHDCLLDTGCSATMVPEHVVAPLKRVKIVAADPGTVVYCADGVTPLRVTAYCMLPVYYKGRRYPILARVSPDVAETMLGIDWLKQHKCSWNFDNDAVRIGNGPLIPLLSRSQAACRRVMVRDTVTIPPLQQVIVPARTTYVADTTLREDPAMLETHTVCPGVFTGRTLLAKDIHDLAVPVVNTTRKAIELSPDTVLGNICQVDIPTPRNESDKATDTPTEFNNDVLRVPMSRLPDDLNETQRADAHRLLSTHEYLFSRGPYDFGKTNLIEHCLDTGDARPFRQPLRRQPETYVKEIDCQVTEMEAHGIVERAASPWASNVLLVNKKDGTFRLCVDYRQLNKLVYKDTYPLPHIDTCLGSLNGATWFSTLDLRSGYHNIPIRHADKDKTAFITRRGCFRYNVLPFGMSTAPANFQRLMDLVLCGLTYQTCLVYLDDIIVFSADFDSHVQRLREVFDRIRNAGLKLHGMKCWFFQRRVSFLGHVVSASGIEMQDDKLDAIRSWPVPKTVRDLRTFAGLTSYYRRFVLHFATVASPLYVLLRKGANFVWGDAQQAAFEKLKELLMSAPILGNPQDEGQFILDTDAASTGLGAVLSQVQGDAEVVLAYASRSLTKPERNYDTTRLELLAIVFGLKSYRQ